MNKPRFRQESSPSKLNILVCVPMMPSTVTRKSFRGPSPAASRQTTEEAEAHDALAQLVEPTRFDGVTSSEPKLNPDTVRLYLAVDTPLSSVVKLTEGAARFRIHIKRNWNEDLCGNPHVRFA